MTSQFTDTKQQIDLVNDAINYLDDEITMTDEVCARDELEQIHDELIDIKDRIDQQIITINEYLS